MTDLHMLEQIYNIISGNDLQGDLSKITVSESLISSVFTGQTLFSLFDHSKDQLSQIQEIVKQKLE